MFHDPSTNISSLTHLGILHMYADDELLQLLNGTQPRVKRQRVEGGPTPGPSRWQTFGNDFETPIIEAAATMQQSTCPAVGLGSKPMQQQYQGRIMTGSYLSMVGQTAIGQRQSPRRPLANIPQQQQQQQQQMILPPRMAPQIAAYCPPPNCMPPSFQGGSAREIQLHLPTQAECLQPRRSVAIPDAFQSPSHYSSTMATALIEECILRQGLLLGGQGHYGSAIPIQIGAFRLSYINTCICSIICPTCRHPYAWSLLGPMQDSGSGIPISYYPGAAQGEGWRGWP
jgi:hypothetical protein